MIGGIASIGADPISAVSPLKGASELAGAKPQSGFADLLAATIQRVESSGAEAMKAAEGFLSGTGGDVHSAALAGQRASLQFEYFLQVRNKVVQSYQEIMRMQL